VTKEELAAELNGNEYRHEVPRNIAAQAKMDGLVIAYGASDDLMEFDGAIYDERGAYEGATVLIVDGKIFNEDACVTPCIYFSVAKKDAQTRGKSIEAVWAQDGYSWTFKTDIPHATFEVVEDGRPYCRGIVFSLADVS
jgi:hypothetical protein